MATCVDIKHPAILPEHLELLARIKPMTSRLIVTKPKVQEISESRTIVLPDNRRSIDKEFGLETVVLKIGAGVTDEIAVGDTVLIGEFAGVPLVLDTAVPFWSIGEGDIMAVLKPQ